jgi:hypothetical protein
LNEDYGQDTGNAKGIYLVRRKEFSKMLNRFLLCAAVALLFCSGAFANIGHAGCYPVGSFTNIGQSQDFMIGGYNMVKRIGGYGRAESQNMVNVGQCQATYTAGSAAIQKQIGKIAQNASISGFGGSAKVIQNAQIKGSQEQTIKAGKYSMRTQEQNLNVKLDNFIQKSGGIGRAEGAQKFVGSQSQIQNTPGGTSINEQSVKIQQNAKVDGNPCSTIIVNNSVNVQMGQSQNISTIRSR